MARRKTTVLTQTLEHNTISLLQTKQAKTGCMRTGLANPGKTVHRFFARGSSEKSISDGCKVTFTRFCNKQERILGRKLRNVEDIFSLKFKIYRIHNIIHDQKRGHLLWNILTIDLTTTTYLLERTLSR